MKLIDADLMKDLMAKARDSDRGRTHYNLHADLEDPTHRLCIAIHPGSYVRPHIHHDKWEIFVVLKGKAALLFFDEKGRVTGKVHLSLEGPAHVVEIPAKTWHTLVAEAEDTVLLEVKPGPYKRPDEEDFASWAPKEGEELARVFEERYRTSDVGESITE